MSGFIDWIGIAVALLALGIAFAIHTSPRSPKAQDKPKDHRKR